MRRCVNYRYARDLDHLPLQTHSPASFVGAIAFTHLPKRERDNIPLPLREGRGEGLRAAAREESDLPIAVTMKLCPSRVRFRPQRSSPATPAPDRRFRTRLPARNPSPLRLPQGQGKKE